MRNLELKIFHNNKILVLATLILSIFFVVAILSYSGIIASNWYQQVGGSYDSPNIKNIFGTDIFGRSVLAKLIKGTETAISIGFVVSSIAIIIGLSLGLISGYFGGIIDEFIVWLYTTIASIPNIILLIAFTFILEKGIMSVYIALAMTRWVEICRLIRAEVIKQKSKDYIQASIAIGASHFRRIFYHILPNVIHIAIIQFSLVFQVSIKSEVILSYLGLGEQNQPSWGLMINDAKVEIIRGVWWQLVFATIAMFLIVLSFNIVSDALRDFLDPKLRNK
ncbi:MAG: ABC transporter permease [Bacteroidetes bacterium]|nr:ABC transporter permease [Bacteroidota bacterium]